MVELLKLNIKFVFNRSTITIVGIFQLFSIFGIVYSSGIMDGYYILDMNRVDYSQSYLFDSVMIIKVISIMLGIFLTALLNSDSSNNLGKYIIDRFEKKFQIFFSKIIFLILVMGIYQLFFLVTFLIVSQGFTPFNYQYEIIRKVFLILFLQVTTYILITNMLLTILPNILVSLLPILLFWYMEINNTKDLVQANKINETFYQFIPNLILDNGELAFLCKIDNYLIFILLLILGNCLYYVKKEIL